MIANKFVSYPSFESWQSNNSAGRVKDRPGGIGIHELCRHSPVRLKLSSPFQAPAQNAIMSRYERAHAVRSPLLLPTS